MHDTRERSERVGWNGVGSQEDIVNAAFSGKLEFDKIFGFVARDTR